MNADIGSRVETPTVLSTAIEPALAVAAHQGPQPEREEKTPHEEEATHATSALRCPAVVSGFQRHQWRHRQCDR
jgi:hypothetical protein